MYLKLTPAAYSTPQAMNDPYEQYSEAYLSRLESDTSLASSEQARARQTAKPAYCGSRYYTAIAGGGTNCN